MSDVVEKTLSALPSLLSLDSQPGASKLSPTSKLGHLVRSITELTSKNVSACYHISFPDTVSAFFIFLSSVCISKVQIHCCCIFQEEEKLITKELAAIKDQISSPYTTMVNLLYNSDDGLSGSLVL